MRTFSLINVVPTVAGICVGVGLILAGCSVEGSSDQPVQRYYTNAAYICIDGFVYFGTARALTPIFDQDRLPKRCPQGGIK